MISSGGHADTKLIFCLVWARVLGFSTDSVLKQHILSDEASYKVFFDITDGSHITHLNTTMELQTSGNVDCMLKLPWE